MESYVELKNRHEKEINDFPFGFAFTNEQFKEMMEKWGLTENDTDKIVSIGTSGFVRKSDVDDMKALFKRHKEEKEKGYENDQFLEDAIKYELGNHEYIITYEPEPTLNALGFSIDILQDERFNRIFNKAKSKYIKEMEKFGW